MHDLRTDPSAHAATRPGARAARTPPLGSGTLPDPVTLSLQQLAALLDRQPQVRQVMRALAKLEEALKRRGWRALDKMPLPVLERARDQLEGLVSNWSPAGLAALRSKLAVALIERDETVVARPREDYRSTFLLDVRPAAVTASPAVRAASSRCGIPGVEVPLRPLAARPAVAAGLQPEADEEHDLAALMAIYASLGGVLHPQRGQTLALQASVVAAQARQMQARQAALAHWR